MRKVKNRKVIGRLADRSFKASRTRNVIASLAIALTAMLFTALFTIGLGTVENFLSIPGGFTPQFRRLETGVPM